jgi:hypothetical protein
MSAGQFARVLVLSACAASVAWIVGCSLTSSWDGLKIGVAPDAGALQDSAASPDAAPEVCVAGRYYCGGNGVTGDSQSLYLCLPDGGASFTLICQHSCAHKLGESDVCTCVVGSPYCGNDQIVGDSNSLYTCDGDAGVFRQHCDAGCAVVAGSNDVCR